MTARPGRTAGNGERGNRDLVIGFGGVAHLLRAASTARVRVGHTTIINLLDL